MPWTSSGRFDFHDHELWHRLTPETVPLYKQVIDGMASIGHYQSLFVSNRMADHSGWFVSPEQQPHQEVTEAMIDTWFGAPAHPLWQEVADYARKQDISLSTFLLHVGFRRDRPDWKMLARDGQRSALNCFAHAEYVDWYTQQIDTLLSTHPNRHLQWDEGWMGGACYDETHDHPRGDIRYHQFHYVQQFLETIKSRHPDVHLIVITGVFQAIPWVMKHLDADTHTGIISGGREGSAAWYDRNVCFLPAYKMHREGGIHWLIDRGSAGVEASEAEQDRWYRMLEDPDVRRAYKEERDHWMSWIDENRGYLNVRRDLFACEQPGTRLQGTVHCVGDRGFIFLANETDAMIAGEIPIDWLEHDSGANDYG